MTPRLPSFQRAAPLLLAVLWVVAQVAALRYGPRLVYDSHRYLGYARQLTDGWGIGSTHNVRYLGYAAYLSAFLTLGLSHWAMILGQTLLNGLATVAYWRVVRRLCPTDWRPAALATLLVIAWPDLQRFNAYLLTESLFASLVMLSLWAVTRVRGWRQLPTAALVLLAATLVRPNGFLLPAAALVAGFAWAWHRSDRPRRALLAAGGALTLAVAVASLNHILRTYHLIETYARGQIIAGYRGWLVHPSIPLAIPPATLPPLSRVTDFFADQPGYVLRLAALKLLAFVAYVKPYWSTPHNVLAAAVLWPVWVLAATALRRARLPLPARLFIATILFGQAGIVALTIEDWDARFLIPLLPLLFALAAIQGGQWLSRPTQQPATRPA